MLEAFHERMAIKTENYGKLMILIMVFVDFSLIFKNYV